jgi:hypothetical protein
MREVVGLGALALSLVAVLTPGAAAGSTVQSRPTVICPLIGTPGCCGPIAAVGTDDPCCPESGTTECCVPIAATCCATSTCPSALTIAVTPNPASEGRQTTITGTLTGSTSVAAQTVGLWEQAAGQAASTQVASTQTSASGAFSFVRTVTTNTTWYVKVGTVQSATMAEAVLAAVDLHPSRVRIAPGAGLTLSGTIAPSHAGERVALQQLRSGHWVTIARPKLGINSSFTVTRNAGGHSVKRFRIVLAADARNARSISRIVAITVR